MAAVQTIGFPTDAARFTLPHVPGIDQVPQRISAEDESELRWYLDDPFVAGIARTGGFGGQLSRAEAFGFGALPCRACGGTWRRRIRQRDGAEVIVGWQDGTGRRPKRHFGRQETYAGALARYRLDMRREHRVVLVTRHPDDEATREAVEDAFHLQGQVPMTEAEVRQVWDRLPDERTVECQACGGLGVVPRRAAKHGEVTVWPTGSSKRTGAREAVGVGELVSRAVEQGATSVSDGYGGVHLGELERYLDVDRILRDVAELSVVARVALEEYYQPPREGRPRAHEALWPLTTVGTAPGVSPLERSARARQADELYGHACSVYNLAAYGLVS